MSKIRRKTIVAFASGRTVTLSGDLVDELRKKDPVTKFQFFLSEDGERWGTVINMNLVETVRVVDDDTD